MMQSPRIGVQWMVHGSDESGHSISQHSVLNLKQTQTFVACTVLYHVVSESRAPTLQTLTCVDACSRKGLSNESHVGNWTFTSRVSRCSDSWDILRERNDTMTKVQQVSRESNMIKKVIYIFIYIYEKGVPGCAWPEGFLVYNSKQNYQARPDEVWKYSLAASRWHACDDPQAKHPYRKLDMFATTTSWCWLNSC